MNTFFVLGLIWGQYNFFVIFIIGGYFPSPFLTLRSPLNKIQKNNFAKVLINSIGQPVFIIFFFANRIWRFIFFQQVKKSFFNADFFCGKKVKGRKLIVPPFLRIAALNRPHLTFNAQ